MTDRPKISADAPSAAGAAGAPRDAAPASADEFAHIPSRRARHPLLAAAAAGLAFFLVFHIRHELRYALSATAPLDLGDARVTFSPAMSLTGIENRYVRVRGTPDRESALELDTKGSWVFSQFFRILGTGDGLYVHRRENPLPAARAEQDAFEGRLVRFRDLSFADAIRGYFSAHVTATHFLDVADLARALGEHPGAALALRDRAGDAVTVAPGDELALDVIRPDEVRIGLPRDRFASDADARAAIEQEGGQVMSALGVARADAPGGIPTTGPLAIAGGAAPLEHYLFVARFPADRRDAALSALGELDRRVTIRDARETVRARADQVRADPTRGADGAALLVETAAGSPRRLPLGAIAAARTLATVQISPDAYLVIEADQPREHLPTLLMGLLLAMFGAVNVVGLLRELRR